MLGLYSKLKDLEKGDSKRKLQLFGEFLKKRAPEATHKILDSFITQDLESYCEQRRLNEEGILQAVVAHNGFHKSLKELATESSSKDSLGNDNILGSHGADILTGGADADNFDFNSFVDSNSSTCDTITDFVRGEDTIDLVGLSGAGITQFSDFTVSNDGTDTFVEANSYDFEIKLTGVLALDETDFDFA